MIEVGHLNEKQIAKKALNIRVSIIKMLEKAKSGHAAGPLGLADIFAVLFFNVLQIRAEKPDWPMRDMLILSNGHCAPVLYAAMAERGFFDKKELLTLRKFGSRLQGHPERQLLPGLETTSGPLGSGLSQAAGYAYSLQHLDGDMGRFVYCVMSDGELNEGNTWEAAMFAGKYKLSQLVAIIDRNNIQISGSTEEVMPLEDLKGKWESFGWHVQEVDGHNIQSVSEATSMARAITNRPSVIIAHTIPGRGVGFMEYDYKWHGQPPNPKQAKLAVEELQANSGGGLL